MDHIQRIHAPHGEERRRLLAIWESAVTQTHHFLSQEDITALRPEVERALAEMERLYVYREEDGVTQGFLGFCGNKVEMLFVDAGARGKGIGGQLLDFAITGLGARYVDVNEQNEQGVGFYRHKGFRVIDRSDRDGQGRPFPILHLGR